MLKQNDSPDALGHTDQEARTELLNKARKTTNARFAAYRRLRRRANTATIIFLLFSVVVIIGSTYILAFPLSEIMSRFISFSMIVLSLTTTIFQLYEQKQNYEERSYRLYKCSLALSEFCNELELRKKPISMDTAIERYHSIINDYEENHSDIDFFYTKYRLKKSNWDDIVRVTYYKALYWLDGLSMLVWYSVGNSALIYAIYIILSEELPAE